MIWTLIANHDPASPLEVVRFGGHDHILSTPASLFAIGAFRKLQAASKVSWTLSRLRSPSCVRASGDRNKIVGVGSPS